MTTGVCLKRIVSSINSGTAIDKEKIENNALYPVYGGGNKVGFCNEYNCGDAILIGRVGSCGHITLVKEKCWATDNALIIKTKYNLSYIAYILRCADFSPLISQTAMPLLTGGKLKELVVPFVFDEYRQAQIVHFLDHKCSAIDTAIEKTKKSIEKLEEYKKAVITKAVTKGIDPNAKMKDSGVEWIGEIPEGWEVSKFKFHTKQKSDRNPGNATVLSLYREHGIVIKDSRDDNHNRTSLDTSTYRYVEVGDFVVNKMKAWQGSVAVSDYTGVVSPAYYVYRITDKKIYPLYFHHLLRSCYKDEFMRLSGGIRIGQWDLPADALENTLILIPPYENQVEIANFLERKCTVIDTAIEKKKKATEKWEEYKKSLIYYAVTGKIDCRNEVVK